MPPHRMPAAEVEVSADLVRRLLADQHPDLARLPVEFLANGWDNAMFRLGTELAVRMPRRQLGAAIIAHEQRWLPKLAPRLPLPVPYPERTGHSALGYPYSWSVVPFLRGVPATDSPSVDLASAELASDELAAMAVAVGGFLGALHVPAPEDAPANPVRGVPLAERAAAFEANLAVFSGETVFSGESVFSGETGFSADGGISPEAVLPVWESALAAPVYGGPPVWLHGDLHPANILVDDGRVSGVIDFGDITSGDPATDLAVAWMLLPLSLHGAFRAAYEDAGGAGGSAEGSAEGDALWLRARGWALHFALVYLTHSADNPQLFDVGRRTLGRTV